MQVVTLLVVGAGPYGVAVAAQAIERGVDTAVVGRPMGFWTDHMPEGMFLRSGTDWHLDASGVDTFEAFIEDRGLSSAQIDPVPIDRLPRVRRLVPDPKAPASVRDRLVSRLERNDDAFVASLVNAHSDSQLFRLTAATSSPASHRHRETTTRRRPGSRQP
jgi:hypothetical protein